MTTLLRAPLPASPRRGPRRRWRRSTNEAALPATLPNPCEARARPESSAITSAFMMLAIVCLWAVTQMLFLGGASHSRAQELLYDRLRVDLAGATAPLGPVIEPGEPVALVTIPRIGLEEVVVEGTASGDMLKAAGHLRSTVLPGQSGTSVLMGRAATYGKPFGDVVDLVPGDQISTVTAQGETAFTVIGVRREGDRLPQPLTDGSARLTLVTAEGSGRLAAITPDSVVYIDADGVVEGESFAAPPGRPGVVPDSEKPLASDRGVLPLLALDLALLLALTLGVIAARQRWGATTVWVVAAPVAIALAWTATDAAMRLFPNVM